MLYRRILLLLIIISGSIACTEQRKKKTVHDAFLPELIQFKIEKPNVAALKPLLLSCFVDSVWYLQLETSRRCLLPPRVGLYKTNDFIFTTTRNEIYQFDSNGNFVRQIGSEGKGPGEFRLNKCGFDDDNRRITVMSHYTTSPLVFDFNGKFLENINDSLITSCYGSLELFDAGNGFFIYVNQPMDVNHQWGCKPYELVVYDFEKNRVTQTLTNQLTCEVENERHYNSVRPSLQLLTRYDSLFYYKSFYNDTLYSVNSNNIKPFAIIDFGDLKFPGNTLYSPNNNIFQLEMVGKMRIIEMIIKKNFIFFEVLLHKAQGVDAFICKYDVTSGELTYHTNLIINDIDGGQNMYLKDLLKGMTCVLFQNDFLEELDKKRVFSTLNNTELKYPELKGNFEDLQKNRKDELNPMLMIYN